MSEKLLTIEFGLIQRSTRRSIFWSTVAHVALLLLLVISHKAASESANLTEITWIEPEPPVQEVVPPPVEVRMKASSVPEVTEVFERAEAAPKPLSRAPSDIVTAKLDAIDRAGSSERTRVASLVSTPKVGLPSLANVRTEDALPIGSPTGLSRDDSPTRGAPVALQRTESKPGTPVAAVAVSTPPAGRGGPSGPATTSTSKRDLGGAQLVGPVADRPLISYQVPVYPEWAKRDGVEGSVTLYFFVMPDGRVKENILVERTSGFSDFDTGAVDALRQWRFKAIPGSGEQWGRITFNYRLSD